MIFYSFAIYIYTLSIRIASVFNPKAKLWVKGRHNWRNNFQQQLQKINSHPKIWIHCASLGEFEQGRPIIETLKIKYPQYKIVLSFFSPSGYELRKSYEGADVITYLPEDTKENARDFINYCNPHTVIFIKYEFWLNYLFELDKKKIPVYLASGVIKKHQPFFKWYGKPFIKALATFKKIIVQDKNSLELLHSLNIKTGLVGGDTRIDRVYSLREKSLDISEIKDFSLNHWVIVGGSTWPKDEVILIDAYKKLKQKYPTLKLIIAPHEIDIKNISRLTEMIKNKLPDADFSLYTSSGKSTQSDILILNTIGLLSLVYQCGKMAYIGGGFDNGIHNILEPATYGLPITFGPNHKKFNEALDLINNGGAKHIQSENELYLAVECLFTDKNLYSNSAQACVKYIDLNKGACEKVIAELSI